MCISNQVEGRRQPALSERRVYAVVRTVRVEPLQGNTGQ